MHNVGHGVPGTPAKPGKFSGYDYLRDQGFGTYEENLAAFIHDLNTNQWPAASYAYHGTNVPAVANSGNAFDDARQLLYYRNQDFNATDPLAVNPVTGKPIKPDEVRHQFGAALGGPIRSNKLFFFLSYDAQMRDFPLLITDTSNVLNNGGTPVAPADTAAFNAGRNFLLGKFPGGAPGNTIPRNFNHHLGLAKVDWTINQANDLSITYNHLTHSALNGIQTALVLGAVGNNGSDDVRLDSLNLRLTTVVNSHQVNEARFQWGRDFEFEFGNAPGPNVAVGGFSFGLATFLPRAALPDERHYQFVDNYSWTVGAHTLKFGADINHINDLINNPSFFAGAYSYTNAVNLGRDLLNPAATPNYNSFSQNFGLPGIQFATNEIGFFGQDQWKILKNVTVNYGVRYDYQALPGVVAPNAAFVQTQKFHGDKLDFQPRVGLAWDLRGNGQTVVRGGYGLFYATTSNGIIDNALRQTGINDPTKNTLRTSFQKADPGAPHFPNVLSAVPANPTLSLTLLDPKFKRPRAQEVNIGLEQQIFPKTTLSVNYIYNRGDSLPVQLFGAQVVCRADREVRGGEPSVLGGDGVNGPAARGGEDDAERLVLERRTLDAVAGVVGGVTGAGDGQAVQEQRRGVDGAVEHG